MIVLLEEVFERAQRGVISEINIAGHKRQFLGNIASKK